MQKRYDFDTVITLLEDCKNERSEWEAEWRQISDYLLPGRGVYYTYSKPRKRQLSSPKVVNNIAEDALYVLTSGMHSGLTSPARPWFTLSWADKRINDFEPLKMWMQECQSLLQSTLHDTNFYSMINSFYAEYAGFGLGCVYVGEDTDDGLIPFRFELLTVGEYYFSLGANGKPDLFMRTIYKSPAQLVQMFPDTISPKIKEDVEKKEAGTHVADALLLEVVYASKYMDKSYVQEFFELTGEYNKRQTTRNKQPLQVKGFYEFPYAIARWHVIGSDTYSVGAGSRALPHIKRLQEMEKAFLMATHKNVDPPLNAPARMSGKLNTLPGGRNYYANPNETINEIYQARFDYQGVAMAVERVEQRIGKVFYNDIFLTGARDPNASPYKAAEVNAREQEKMLRLGPVIERLQSEFFEPIIERCFNIMLRKGLFPELPPEYAEMAGDYAINIVSPLAAAQKAVALQGINSFLAFIGQVATFDQSVMDNVDIDEAAREYGDITGVPLGVMRLKEKVSEIRAARQQQMQKEKERQDSMVEAQLGSQMNSESAKAQKAQAEASKTMVESQQISDMGIM